MAARATTSDLVRHIPRLPNGDWHPEAIKAVIRIKLDDDGVPWTLDRLAVASGLPAHACRRAIRRPHYQGEMAVTRLLRLPPSQIWPSRFRRDGTRIAQIRPATQSILSSVSGHVQKGEAA